ncbi:GtrA family protein [Vagococcus salmoninarum]|uniref:GtrA family protein n=1 Tax=Vagococcus salmoninarum TaxID=2739 RepID=UPI001881CB32|nr:GtrA family protein [Vagococcus salmoninarum]MBE9388507.1 GtrA family protein [Vagococcus salmoninarum]
MKKIKELLFQLSFMTDHYYSILMYLVMGGITTFINIFVFWLFNSQFGLNYTIANIIAWFFSVLFAYVSNKFYVFESTNTSLKTLIKEASSFFFFRVLSLFMDLIAMYVCISLLGINPLIAKILANVIVLIANYGFSKFFIFKK